MKNTIADYSFTSETLSSSDLILDQIAIRVGHGAMFNTGNSQAKAIWRLFASAVESTRVSKAGNLTLVGDMLNNMPKGTRAKDIADWIAHATPIHWDAKTGKVNLVKAQVDTKKTERMYRRDRSNWDMAFLLETPWYDFEAAGKEKKQLPYTIENVRNTLEKLLDPEDTATRAYDEDLPGDAAMLIETIDAIIASREAKKDDVPEAEKIAA